MLRIDDDMAGAAEYMKVNTCSEGQQKCSPLENVVVDELCLFTKLQISFPLSFQ